MSRGTGTIKDTREEARRRRKRKKGIPYERWEEREKEKKESKSEESVSKVVTHVGDGVIGYELTDAKGPSRTPLRAAVSKA